MNKNQSQYSKSAIIIRRLKNTQLTLNEIRQILTRETKDRTMQKQIYCGPSKDKNAIIIKTTDDKDTNKLLQSIENITSLKDIIETTYKSTNLKKIIILGIPKEIPEDEIMKIIDDEYKSDVPVAKLKTIQKEYTKNYQLVLEVEDWIAKSLISKNLHLGFLQCRVCFYIPIIRCNNCQTYGHTDTNCRSKEVCAYCAKHHKSQNCKHKDSSKYHRCINCLGTGSDFPHTANSPDCPAFHYYIQARNHRAKNNLINPRRIPQ